jgi:antitoxin HicB
VILYPEPEEGGYSVLVPLLPGCVTQGETLDDALANAREAIALHLRGLERADDYIPEEETPPVVATVELPTRPEVSA